jgi:phosphohistidine phosphatase
MRLYLFRHGEALAKDDPSVPTDADRPLVAEGVKRTRQAAEGIRSMNIPFDAVFTSPWLRARQTAQAACETLGIAQRLQVMEELAGDRTIEAVMNALVKYSQLENVMLVGHNPLLSDLAAYLLCHSTSMQIDLKKSGMCAVEVTRIPPRDPGTLLWMMTAKQLRAIR